MFIASVLRALRALGLAAGCTLLISHPSAAQDYPQQTINSFSPTSGPVGTVITVVGEGFTGSNEAWFGDNHHAAIKVLSDTRVEVTVPAGSTTATVSIHNPQHGYFAGGPFTVTYPKPTVSSFLPLTGSAGTVVTVTGKGFTAATAAAVGTYKDYGLKIVSDTQAQFTIPAGAKSGTVAVSNPLYSGASLLSFTVVTLPTLPTVTLPKLSAIRVLGSNFVNALGLPVQLRGVNFSAFEAVAIGGWDPADPTGSQSGQPGGPKWSAVQAWKANVVRFPMNEASWLGYTCVDTSGAVHNPDPGANYKAALKSQVDAAIAAGLYVILDLHWTAPGNTCPMLQTQMADADHSLDFWTSVAKAYKNYPQVMFELFNEPFFNFDFEGDRWQYMMKGTGGQFTGYAATSNSGEWKDVKQPWAIASYQQMIDAVRATGATNVVLIGTNQYSSDLSGWLANKPSDPLGQMAAVWHAYPTYDRAWGSAEYAQPNWSPGIYADVLAIQDAGIPVIATETGDRNLPGTVGAPLVSTVTQWADEHNVSVLGWTWDVWGESDNVLIKDVNGTPTDGYGEVFHDWLVNHK